MEPNGAIKMESHGAIDDTIYEALIQINSYNEDKSHDLESSLQELIYALIQMLRHLEYETIRIEDSKYLEKLDVFGPLISKEFDYKLELITILVAYFYINPKYRCLVINANHHWDKLVKETENAATTITAAHGAYPGFYTIIKEVEKFETFDLQLLNFVQFNFQNVLIESWILMFKQDITSSINWEYYLSRNKVPYLINNESWTDHFIANNISTDQLDINSSDLAPYRPLILKSYNRIALLKSQWVSKKLYNLTLQNLLQTNHDMNEYDVLHNPLKSSLQVLMEIIDHPEYNLLQETKLILLLYISLQNIYNTPCNQIHEILSKLEPTQSLLSLINMTNFVLANYLNQFQISSRDLLRNNTKSNQNIKLNSKNLINGNVTKQLSKYEIPTWFKDDLLPKIPPIAKSLFVFDKLPKGMGPNLPIDKSLTILLDCLNLTVLSHNNILKQYHRLNIHFIELNIPDNNVNIEYLLKDNFFQLNYIPIFTTLLAIKNTPFSSTQVINMKRVMLLNACKYVESLILSYNDVALYHLIKFISRISQENLVLQKISVQLLTHLLFHNKGPDPILQVCKENKLIHNELLNYVTLWNNGTAEYTPFYTELFDMKQPMVQIKKVNIRQLQELIPTLKKVLDFHDNMEFKRDSFDSKTKNVRNFSSSSNFNTSAPSNSTTTTYSYSNDLNGNNNNGKIMNEPIQPTPQKSMKNYMTPAKYDAYSSPVFIPSHNSSVNNSGVMNSNNTSSLMQQSYVPPPPPPPPSQQPSNPGNNMYSTPISYMKQQQQTQPQTKNVMNNMDQMSNLNTNNNNVNNMNQQGIQQNDIYPRGNFTLQTNYMTTPPNIPMAGNNNIQILSSTNAAMFNSAWNESPAMSTHTPQSKIVNTGKNYILGGHNRVKNNSRAQSIHIDQFENI